MLKDTLTAIRHNRLKKKYRNELHVWNERKDSHDIKYCVAGGKELDFKSLHIPKLLWDRL